MHRRGHRHLCRPGRTWRPASGTADAAHAVRNTTLFVLSPTRDSFVASYIRAADADGLAASRQYERIDWPSVDHDAGTGTSWEYQPVDCPGVDQLTR
jgi:hypothetical protein